MVVILRGPREDSINVFRVVSFDMLLQKARIAADEPSAMAAKHTPAHCRPSASVLRRAGTEQEQDEAQPERNVGSLGLQGVHRFERLRPLSAAGDPVHGRRRGTAMRALQLRCLRHEVRLTSRRSRLGRPPTNASGSGRDPVIVKSMMAVIIWTQRPSGWPAAAPSANSSSSPLRRVRSPQRLADVGKRHPRWKSLTAAAPVDWLGCTPLTTSLTVHSENGRARAAAHHLVRTNATSVTEHSSLCF